MTVTEALARVLRPTDSMVMHSLEGAEPTQPTSDPVESD
jgi:hypothetical protein